MIIKQTPEDFQVIEKANLPIKEKGGFSYWKLKKINMTTIDAIMSIARFLRFKEKYVGFAGTKDKKAVTEQFISIRGRKKDDLIGFKNKSCSLEFAGYGDAQLSLGDLLGNEFVITVRDLETKDIERAIGKLNNNNNNNNKNNNLNENKNNNEKNSDNRNNDSNFKFINYFGEQRFSIKNTVIGKLLLKKKYKEALMEFSETGNYEIVALDYLKEMPNDYVGALKKIPKTVLIMYIHAYQSLLWNEYAPLIEEDEIPLLGFGTALNEKESLVINPIIKREEISLRDFINNSFPELSLDGSLRVKPVSTKIEYEIDTDELNKEKKKMIIKFFLPKGCYATELCKQLF